MTSAWNRRHVSSLLVGLCLWPILAAAEPQLVFVSPESLDPEAEGWRAADQAWLQSQPARNWRLVATVGRLSPALPDSQRQAALASLGPLFPAGEAKAADAVLTAPHEGLRARWLARGYLQADLQLAGVDSVTGIPARLLLEPGPRFSLGGLQVGGANFPGRAHLLATWLPRPGAAFNAAELRQGIQRLLTGAGEAGFPFARWVTREVVVDAEAATVTVEATLLPGQMAYLGPVTSSLPNARAGRFLARASGLQTGDLLRHSDLERATQRLQIRDLYARVDAPQVYLTTSPDTVGVFFPVTARRKVNRLQVLLGLSREAETGANRLSGQVDLSLPDLAGSGRRLTVGWRDDGRHNRRFGLTYGEPLAFGTPLDTDFALDHEVEQDSYTRFRLENRWRLPVVAMWGLELGVGWDRSTFPVGPWERTSRLRGRAAILHRRGDATRSGWSGLFAVETASRTAHGRTVEATPGVPSTLLGQSIRQRILEGDLAGEQWLGMSLSLAGRGAFRQLTGGTEEGPVSEQFRFGGATSLRGFREDEFHGTRVAYGGVELRIGRPGGSRLYTFYDLGYFEFSALEASVDEPDRRVLKQDWPRGYGLGILARTAAGDISLAVGFPGTVDFDLAKLHVTLLESF